MDIIDGFDENPKWSKDFPVIGKGILFFNFEQKSPFALVVRPVTEDLGGECWIGVVVGTKRVSFHLKLENEHSKEVCSKSKDEKYFGKDIGIDPEEKVSYWISYDSDRKIVKYGKGYCMEKTTILEYNFEDHHGLKNDHPLFEPSIKRKVQLHNKKSLCDEVDTYASGGILDVEPEVEFDCDPLISDVKPLVMDSSKANLFYLDEGRYLYSSSLPPVCQTLYANVTAANMDLDYVPPDVKQYDFLLSDAIRHSIETKGCALYEKLRKKKGEFGDLSLTYLRITLGKEFGASPGVPYVLELWPKSHGSPIHNHGNAYAVIRVLHGGITIHYYNKMKEISNDSCKNPDDFKELGKINVKKGDVTWISPRWYQTHRLHNDTDDYCATVQCYAYGRNDHTHWPYFDYIGSCSRIAEFLPDSDFSFTKMYHIVMEEYAHRRKPAPVGSKEQERPQKKRKHR